MPVDCSMTNWFYNSIKGGGDKQGSGGSSPCGCESLGQIPEWERLPQARADLARWVITAEPDATEAERSVRVRTEAPSPRAEALFRTEARSPSSERMRMCPCGVHLRGSCVVYSENTTDLKVGV